MDIHTTPLKGEVTVFLDPVFFWTKKKPPRELIVLRAQKERGAQILARFQAFGLFNFRIFYF